MNNLFEKFGQAGLKGSIGEKWFFKHLKETYDEVQDYREDYIWQMFGVDFGIKRKNWSRFFLLDVKTNLKDNGTFYIELDAGRWKSKIGWFFTSRADRIVHVNPEKEHFIWYDLSEMREELFFRNTKEYLSNDRKVLILNINNFSRNSNLIKNISCK